VTCAPSSGPEIPARVSIGFIVSPTIQSTSGVEWNLDPDKPSEDITLQLEDDKMELVRRFYKQVTARVKTGWMNVARCSDVGRSDDPLTKIRRTFKGGQPRITLTHLGMAVYPLVGDSSGQSR
jgi:hypothetical protein